MYTFDYKTQLSFEEVEITCPKCGWKGLGRDSSQRDYEEGGIGLFCPKCNAHIDTATYHSNEQYRSDIIQYGTEEQKRKYFEDEAIYKKFKEVKSQEGVKTKVGEGVSKGVHAETKFDGGYSTVLYNSRWIDVFYQKNRKNLPTQAKMVKGQKMVQWYCDGWFWLHTLEKEKRAICIHNNGYPSRYAIQLKELLPIIKEENPPEAIKSHKYESNTIEWGPACFGWDKSILVGDTEEWLIIETWDKI